ncbi:MAG: FAD-binding protein [Planctomycetes bacterium]|nr:FAD-binding protein [Planctomycetota bacterium]
MTNIARALRQALPGDRILTDPGEIALYDADGLMLHRRTPGGVVLVRSREEALAVLRILHRQRVPFVPRGAGTGLSGGAVPLDDAWVVDVHRMRRVLHLDPVDRFARVEPGVINLDLDHAAAAHGLRYAPDPSSQKVCTIGGNVAENSGGPHCFLHGMTSRHVLGVTFALPDGEVIELGGPPGTATGIDWRGLFIGAEGTFGITLEAVLQLVARPEVVRTYLAAFPTLVGACHTVSRIIREGLQPGALEILDRLTIRAIEDSVFRAGYPTDAEAVLLLELEGTAECVEYEAPLVEAACRAEGCLTLEEADDEEGRQRLWRGRKGAFGAMGRLGRDLYVLDGVVPRSRLAEVIEEVQRIGERYAVRLSNVFHAGDGNLHPNISFDSRDPDETARVQHAGREILELCVEVGGTLSGEHGIGLEKREFMPWVFDEDDLATQLAVRDAIDPRRLSNPGKIFPTGRSCTESGVRTAEHADRVERLLGRADDAE